MQVTFGSCKRTKLFQVDEAAVSKGSETRCFTRATQGPLWRYSKVDLRQTCQFLTIISRKMAPRTRKRLHERGRDTPTKGLLWYLAREKSPSPLGTPRDPMHRPTVGSWGGGIFSRVRFPCSRKKWKKMRGKGQKNPRQRRGRDR